MDVVGGIVERVVCEVFMTCDLVELCVKSGEDIHSGVSRTDLETEGCESKMQEERICTLSWADELRLYHCYWRDSRHRSAAEVNPVRNVQLSDALWTRNEVARRRTREKEVEDEYTFRHESSGAA